MQLKKTEVVEEAMMEEMVVEQEEAHEMVLSVDLYCQVAKNFDRRTMVRCPTK